MMDDTTVTFLASFPNIQTAIRVAGDGGARILLDIPEDELPSIARLLLMRGIVLRVTVEPETLTNLDATEDNATTEEPKRNPAHVDKRRAAKRRN
jgi:hypothetical protein